MQVFIAKNTQKCLSDGFVFKVYLAPIICHSPKRWKSVFVLISRDYALAKMQRTLEFKDFFASGGSSVP